MDSCTSEINKILVIGEIDDYHKSIKRHYSFTKGLGIATGFSKLAETFYLTKGKEEEYMGTKFINISNITDEFMDTIDFILLIREHNVLQVLNIEPIRKVLFNKKKRQNVGMKSDALGWLWTKQYFIEFPKKYNEDWLTFVAYAFNFLCVQTEEFKKQGLSLILRKRPNRFDDFKDKIFVSRMGVFPDYPLDETLENPYLIDHSYCVDDFTKLNAGKALHPLCYMDRNIKYSLDKGVNYRKEKTIIIYMGRIRTNSGKIVWMMRDIMKELGDEYELHVFPGRFNIPNSNVSVFSSKYPSNLQILRDTCFFDCKNVVVHYPFDDKTKKKYLQFADIGLDFSSVRPDNRKCPAGNAKLLEYCNYGIKVITEKNVNNSHLVTSAKNGILLKGVSQVEDYVNGIKKLKEMCIDRDFAINTTIAEQNWDIISSEMFFYVYNLQKVVLSGSENIMASLINNPE